MADRTPYSIPQDQLPKGDVGDFRLGTGILPQPLGYVATLGIACIGIFASSGMGTIPWIATDFRTVVITCLSLWLATVTTAAMASNGRMAPLGLFVSVLAQYVSFIGLAKGLRPAIDGLLAEGAYIWLFMLFLLVTLPIAFAPLSLRRMRETLWQDVSYSSADELVMAFGIGRAAWFLQHLGSLRSDRYAVVTSGSGEGTRHFVLDKMEGRLAGVSNSVEAEKALGMLGYGVEHIADEAGVVRTYQYSVRPWDQMRFENPPERGITAEEYYHRYI